MAVSLFRSLGYLACLVACSLAAGCGAGTAVIIGLSSSGGSGGNGSPIAAGLAVTNAKSSPATVTFLLSDAESNPTDVELVFVDAATSEETPLKLVADPAQD